MFQTYQHIDFLNLKGGLFHSSSGVARDRLFLCQNKRTIPELEEKSGTLIKEFGNIFDPQSIYVSPFELFFMILIPKHIAKHLAPKMDDQRRFIPEFQQWIEFPSQGRIIFTVRTVETGEHVGDQNNLQFRIEIRIGASDKIEDRVIRPDETLKNTGNKPADAGNIIK